MAIYSNAYYARLLECLREEYQVLLHALGEEVFDNFAVGYLQEYPSQSYTLGELGTKFPRYLAETRPPKEADAGDAPDWADFLIDLAVLSRAFNEVFDGPGVEGQTLLGPEQVAAIPAERWPDARLLPVPCLRLLALRFPAQTYFSAVRQEEQPEFPAAAETFLAVTRLAYVVRHFPLSRSEHAALTALVDGQTVAEALEAAAQVAGPDLEHLASEISVWFQYWATNGFFASVKVGDAAVQRAPTRAAYTKDQTMFDLSAIQQALRDQQLDGWLLYDFRGLNVLARRVLDLPTDAMLSRRWFYFIPAQGEPRKLVHRIEPHALDAFPARPRRYLRWQELEAGVAALVAGSKRVAMEYVPRNANPYVSRVDAGTVELVRSCGVEVVPSGDLVQLFEACWDDEQWAHAPRSGEAHALGLRRGLCASSPSGSAATARVPRDRGAAAHPGSLRGTRLVTDHPPIVGVGPHSGDPHYAPRPDVRRADPRRRLRADRPVGQAGPAAGRLQRPDVDRLRRQGGAAAVRRDLSTSWPGARDAAIDRVRNGLRDQGERCRAGRWTRRRAT